jgi:EAL domain-containing protein (putative c-di-GMP-specific phosphodiesterase class I)
MANLLRSPWLNLTRHDRGSPKESPFYGLGISQLVMFPFDKIKIDKSFTQNLTKRADCAAIISATLTLAQSLSIETTAEGVETIEQSRLLRLAGVTSLQGYLFKRPVPTSEIDFDSVYSNLLEDAA